MLPWQRLSRLLCSDRPGVGHVMPGQATDVPSLEALLASIAQVLHHARQCVPDGARLLLVDFWTGPTHTHSPLAALMAGEFHIHNGGDVYREAETRGWLTASGWRTIERTPLAGPVSLLVAETAA
jgi:hypothetical protein